MRHKIQFDIPDDPLYRGAQLDHRAELPLLGIPVRFESNSPEVVAVAEEAFRAQRTSRGLAEPPAGDPPRVRITVHEGDEGTAAHAPVAYRMPDNTSLLASTPGSIAYANVTERDAIAYVTPALVADRQHFRYSFVEALALFLVSYLDRQPLHAAAIVRGSRVLLLAGPSGVGKSTLVYVALRAGFQALAEDMVWLQLHPRFRVWGMPGSVHLPPDAASFFSGLATQGATLMANGKWKIAVTVNPETIADVPVAERGGICLLERSGDAASLTRVRADEVERVLALGLEGGFDRYETAIRPAVQHLCADGGWHLHLSNDPSDALPFLDAVLTELERRD